MFDIYIYIYACANQGRQGQASYRENVDQVPNSVSNGMMDSKGCTCEKPASLHEQAYKPPFIISECAALWVEQSHFLSVLSLLESDCGIASPPLVVAVCVAFAFAAVATARK